VTFFSNNFVGKYEKIIKGDLRGIPPKIFREQT